MDGPAADPGEESIGDLFGRLVEDGRAYAEAELKLAKAIAEYRAQRAGRALGAARRRPASRPLRDDRARRRRGARPGAIYEPVPRRPAVAAILAGLGYALVAAGLKGMKGLGRDQAEQAALDRGAQP